MYVVPHKMTKIVLKKTWTWIGRNASREKLNFFEELYKIISLR